MISMKWDRNNNRGRCYIQGKHPSGSGGFSGLYPPEKGPWSGLNRGTACHSNEYLAAGVAGQTQVTPDKLSLKAT